jgi:hypothetical protein
VAQALITFDQPTHATTPKGSAGRARNDLELGEPVVVRNTNNTDVTRWRWQLRDQPVGSTATISDPTSATITFTPDIAGSYRITLSVNEGLPHEIDSKIGAVLSVDGYRYPATDERATEVNWLVDGETNTKGWGKDLEVILRNAIDSNSLAGTLVIGNTSGGTDIVLTNGDTINGEGGGTFAFSPAGNIVMTPVANVTCTGDLIGTGKLTLANFLAAIGSVFSERAAVPPGAVAAGKGTVWVKNTVPCVLMYTDDTGTDFTIASLASIVLQAVLAAGNEMANGQTIVGEDGGSISFQTGSGIVTLTASRISTLYVADADPGDAPAGGDELVIGDGAAANYGMTIFTGAAAIGALLFTDTVGAYQGALRYDHTTNRLYLDADGAARAYIDTSGLFPTTTAAYDIGSTSVRWRDIWASRAMYIAGGVAGHDANADDLSIGDGSGAAAGMTLYSTLGAVIYFADTLGGAQGGFTYIHSSDTLTLLAAGDGRVQVLAASFNPQNDNAIDLGLAAKRWVNGYFSTSVVVPLVQGVDFGVGSGAGSALVVRGGEGGTTGGAGGPLTNRGGNAQSGNAAGGDSSTAGGAGSGSGAGGIGSSQGGAGGATGAGGVGRTRGGAGGATSGTGGAGEVVGGAGTAATATGGPANVTGGAGGSGAAAGGPVNVTSGAGGGVSGSSGAINIATGTVAGGQTRGSINLDAPNVIITNHGYHSVRGATARGAVNTLIYRWTSVVDNVGTDITYTDSANDGGSWAIVNAGVYTVSVSIDVGHAGYIAIKKAAAVSNTFDATDIQVVVDCAGGNSYSMSWTGYCSAGDDIWIACSTATNPTGTPINNNRVTVVRVR